MPITHPLEDLIAQAEIYDLVDVGPTVPDLAYAPKLDNWVAMQDRVGHIMLFGHVTGHPRLGDRDIHTSQVYGLDAEAGWARTHNRWYRLGTQHPGQGKEAFRLPTLHTLSGSDEIRAVLTADADMVRALMARIRKP